MINPAVFALQKRTIMVMLTVLLVGAGIISYQNLGRLEDPGFTIKTALIVTPYPGASPREVEEEVTDVIEESIQSMDQIKEIYSTSEEGVSYVYVDMQDHYTSSELPQIWDELRKKVNQASSLLPPGAAAPIVNDDFGDVYGLYFALTGEGRSYAELKEYANVLKKELLLCDDVAKIDFWGTRRETIFIEASRTKLAELGISPADISRSLQASNFVTRSGKAKAGSDYLRITPTGDIGTEQEVASLLVGPAGNMVQLGNIARIYRGYEEPERNGLLFDGQPAIAIGIAAIEGGNVIRMGASVERRLEELAPHSPAGMELHKIYYQSDIVDASVRSFVVNLVEAVIIVVVLLMLFMGWQSGLLIGGILLLTIAGTFIAMALFDISLQKMSLGALILALGMLVDNAIVIADGILVRVERGDDREHAALEVVKENIWPLFGATLIAILAFAAIGFAPGNIGEYCRSLFDVLALSLFTSWLLAVTITPLLCVWFLKVPDLQNRDPFDRPVYHTYRRLLHLGISHRWTTIGLTSILLVLALIGFRMLPQAFFANSTQPYFFVNYWKAEGTHIDQTKADLATIERYVRSIEGVKHVSAFLGEGGMRFILPYKYYTPDPAFFQLLVEVEDYKKIEDVSGMIDRYLKDDFPDAQPYNTRIANGPPVDFRIEVRFRGPDPEILQDLARQAASVMHSTPGTRDIRTDWRNRVRVLRPVFNEAQGQAAGISRRDLATALQQNFNGIDSGVVREEDELIPVVLRMPAEERQSVMELGSVQVWSSLTGRSVPLGQVVPDIHTAWEWPRIHRRDREKAVTVQCNPVAGLAEPLRLQMQEEIESIELPDGYRMEWAGEYKESKKGTEPLAQIFPLCILGMFVILVWQFNSVKKATAIFLTVPLSLIGVTAGLLITGQAFGFMAILGFLGLSGMLIKNAIVLVEQTELDLKTGKAPYAAVLGSAVSRVRPVVMAAATTILGMIPLVADPLYSAMATTIMGGLLAATGLTLGLVPVLYTIFYRIPADETHL
ncbi:MAG TPA: efflux RND transporter permease subunit [Prosthecochloris aestuarii]|uniref:Efflux RND transporter permease subunit n=1 Tax=Prosthecochloris aestuarii TaxID=1102 RepID=A0A831ST15_PROAE|nr:efflux RND transporter permease subunit [Prosthecochloris aestuarii]